MAQQPPGTDTNWPYRNRQCGRGKNKPGHTQPDKMINTMTVWNELLAFSDTFFDWCQRLRLSIKIFIRTLISPYLINSQHELISLLNSFHEFIVWICKNSVLVYSVATYSLIPAYGKPLAAIHRTILAARLQIRPRDWPPGYNSLPMRWIYHQKSHGLRDN